MSRERASANLRSEAGQRSSSELRLTMVIAVHQSVRETKTEDQNVNDLHPLSTTAQVEGLDRFASWKLADPRHDFVSVVEKFVPHDGVAREHNQAVPFDRDCMRVSGVRLTDDLGPVIADRLLG